MQLNQLPTPDYNFSPILLDKTIPGCPLPALKQTDDYVQSGLYAWYDADTEEVLYIGKALKMRNRLQQHWYGKGGTSMVELMLDAEIVPMVAVWLCPADQRAGLERKMLDIDMPMYNRRKD